MTSSVRESPVLAQPEVAACCAPLRGTALDADAAQELLAGIDGFEETEEIDGATVYGPAPPDVPEGVDLGDYDSTGQPHRTSSRGQT